MSRDKTEIEKRIEKTTKKYTDSCDNESGCFLSHQLVAIREKAFQAGAKFILELPELKEAVEALEWYATKGEGPYTDAGMWRRAKSALETLKKAGLSDVDCKKCLKKKKVSDE